VASLRKFSHFVFRHAVAGLWERAQPARRVRASSRRFWGRRPLIEKRCEDASHSQLRKLSRGRTSRTQAFRQCKMPWAHSDLSISVRQLPNQRAELWEQRDRRKSREGSGERARVASEFQIRG
jgi:hypothetical protein